MASITKHVWLSVNRLSLAGWFVLAVSTAGLIPMATAQAGQPLMFAQNTSRERARPFPWPQTCAERVTRQVKDIVDRRQQYELTARQSFRLAVLQGDAQRVRQLHKALLIRSKQGSGPWNKARYRLVTLQLALDDAVLANRPTMIKLLVHYGAKPNFVNDEMLAVPAITVGARCGNIAAMHTLYKLGADLSAPVDANSEAPTAARTAIEIAVEARQNAAILWLLRHGIDVCRKGEPKRIAAFVTHPLAKGQLNDNVLKALQCTKK